MKKIPLLTALLFLVTVGHSQTAVIDSLLQVVARHTRDTNEIRALDHLSTEFMRKDLEKAKHYAHQQVALCKALGTTFGLSEGYAGLVLIHQDLGHLDSAQYYLNALETLAKKNPPVKKKHRLTISTQQGYFIKTRASPKKLYLICWKRFISLIRIRIRQVTQDSISTLAIPIII